ncbi:hypothetical protein BSL78_27832 [Apostichopus japonicus]|uniref:Uncharacterized protein n=1 Tax=Stichopus japonicus TaxID=307972 RepID=A0A2G8JHZ1_STIJA|nr:hypothetical protein BSL78_27832 [Apostichopus japonicus]
MVSGNSLLIHSTNHCIQRNMPELGGFDMALPVFHAYGHKLHCQMSYSTRWRKAFGRTEGNVWTDYGHF